MSRGSVKHWCVAAVVATTLAASVVPAVAPASPALNAAQGGRIFVDNLGSNRLTACTLGFNDVEHRRSYTAAHCVVQNEQYFPQGALVYLADSAGKQIDEPAGLIFPARAYSPKTSANDWAVIYWFEDVRVGGNPYGGTVIPVEKISSTDTICFRGYSTHGRSDASTCGKFVGTVENTTYFDAPQMPVPGDSGGPVYIPGRGLVGVISGANYVAGEDNHQLIGFQRASSLDSGPVYGEEQVDDFLEYQYSLRYSTTITNPPGGTITLTPTLVPRRTPAQATFESGAATPTSVPTVAPRQKAVEQAPSGPSASQVIGIIIGILVVVAAVSPIVMMALKAV